MVLAIAIWYLDPPYIVLAPTLPPQIATQPVKNLINLLLPQLSHTVKGKNPTIGGKMKKVVGNAQTNPREQPPYALCKAPILPMKLCPTLLELRNLIHIPRASPLSPTPPIGTSIEPSKESITMCNKTLRTKFSCIVCS